MKKNLLYLLVVVILAVPAFVSILRPGFFPMQDDMQVFRLQQMDKCIKDLQIPCRWVPDAGYQYGYPQFNFYAPLVYYFGEGVHLLGFQFIDTVKIIIITGFVLGALAMFILAREFFGGWPAVIASVLYIYAPFKAQEIYVRGALSEFWASIFFPLILWAAYKLIKKGAKKYLFWTSVGIGGLFLTHNLLSILFLPILVVWIIFWILAEKKRASGWRIILGILLGLGLSMFFVLPLIFEMKYVHIETLLGGYFDYRQHFVTLKELFFSNNWGYGSSVLGPNDDLSLSTGIVHWVMGLISIILAIFTFKKNRKFSILLFGLGSITLFVLFLTHERSSFIWSIVTPLRWLQFPWRFLAVSVFLLSFMSAGAVNLSGKFKYILGGVAIVAVLILHSSFFKPVSWLNITDSEKLSGASWEKELTASIFDYLPIYAELPPNSKAPALPEFLKGTGEFKNYFKGSDLQTGELSVKETARIRLPIFDFPGMTVYLNGKKIDHVNNDCSGEKDCLGLVSFDASKGQYSFEVKLQNTPIRTIGNLMTLVSFFVLLVLLKKDEKISEK